MKIYKYIIIGFVLGLFTMSCSKDDNSTEYPGNIIIHGDITNMELLDNNGDPKARFHAFSGGSSNDLSVLDGENWTYELWIKVDRHTLIGEKSSFDAETGELIKKPYGSCISERINNFEMYLIEDDDADFAIEYNSLNIDNEPEAIMTSDQSSVNLSFNQWAHIAISRSSTDGIAKFYINGVLIDSSNDPIWKQLADNDKKLNFNCMERDDTFKYFFRGGMNNIRVSTIDRYPTEFTPNYNLSYGQQVDAEGNGVFETDDQGRKVAVNDIDDETLLQLNLDNNLIDFAESSSNFGVYKKVRILGRYTYYIKIHNNYFGWDKNIEDEYPVTGY
jgi:hypothetical protein